MQQKYAKMLSDILRQMAENDHIRLEEIPRIDLYIDQVTHFMEDSLKDSKRYEEDKILTKTMINNYTKTKLLPPPQKKKYSREHLVDLLFIYYFKGFLSLSDIQAILTPINKHFFASDDEMNLQQLYKEIYSLGKEQIHETIEDIMADFHTASHAFRDCSDDNQQFLQLFSFICLLSFDIYLKKEVIEKMIDLLPSLPEEKQ